MSILPFNKVMRDASRGVRKVPQRKFLSEGRHPIVDQGQQLIAGFCNSDEGIFADVPAIVFGDHTRCVKYIEEPFVAGADGVKILVPIRENDNLRYLYHALRSTAIPSLGYSRHFKLVKELNFVVPDRKRQDEIVEFLDAVEVQRSAANEQLGLFDELVKSRFVEMFGLPTEQHDGWAFDRIDAFCDVITGNTPSRKKSEYYGDYIEWIKTDNITDAVHLTEASERLSELGASVGRVVPAGSVLMACIAGSVKSIGKVAIANRSVAFNQQINALVPHEGAIETEYLLWMLRLSKDYLCSDINMQLKGILNKSNLSKKAFSIPPVALQQEFTDFVQHVDKLKFDTQLAIEKLQMLYDSLAQEYFGS